MESAASLAAGVAQLSLHGARLADSQATSSAQESLQHAGPPAESTVAGMDQALQSLRELIGWPLLYSVEGKELGVRWLRGILLHGPPGCGKTLLVRAVAAEYGATVHSISAGSVIGAYTGESEERLREAFEAAQADANLGKPTVVFLDEVDALCPRRDAGRAHESRVVAQLLTLLDGAASQRGSEGRLFVVAATNRPNAIDPALRRAGRLDREIAIPVPNAQERSAILQLQAASMPLAPDVDLPALAAGCVGYSGADLASLCREAAMLAIAANSSHILQGLGQSAAPQSPYGRWQAGVDVGTQVHPEGKKMAGDEMGGPSGGRHQQGQEEGAGGAVGSVRQEHFVAALARVRPSITRGSEVEMAPVTWEDIGGLEEVKRRLRQAVEWPIRHSDAFQRLGLAPPRGVLLHGPPGCCKTTLVRAAASASGASLQALSGAQLYSAFLGEGEAGLRAAFLRARFATPAIIFLDELDSVAGSRGAPGGGPPGGIGGGVSAGARLLSALLTEMDGLELATGVLVLAATNRPTAIDPALLRPGRFDVLLYVPPPDEAGRLATLQIHTRNMPLAADVNLQVLAADTERFTGAELEGICREAALAALREDLAAASHVAMRHFEAARAAARPSLSAEELQQYSSWRRG